MLKKRIPTIVGLLLLVVGAISGVIFINKGTNFLPRAAPEYAPQKVKITNVSENGFVVSWITKEPTTGFIRYGIGASALSITATDDRDQLAGASGEYRTHYISIQNLKPATVYFFKLGSQKNQLYDNNGQPFSLTTPQTVGTPPPADTAYGTVVTTANTPAEGAIVYLSLESATPVSAMVKQNGNWAANLSTARTLDLSNYSTYDPQSARVDILVQPGTGEQAQVTTTVANTKPVSPITLGETRNDMSAATVPSPSPSPVSDLTEQTLSPSPTPVTESEPAATPEPENKFSTEPLNINETKDGTLSITSLPKDGSEITNPRPTITGKAPQNVSLVVSVHSTAAFTGQTVANTSGKWEWTPPADLEPGNHTVTVSYTDESGQVHKVTRDFVVTSLSTESVNLGYSATPSAEPETAATPTPKPTATPQPSSTPRPSPTPRTTSATASATPASGSIVPTMSLILFGFLSLGFGLATTRRQSR